MNKVIFQIGALGFCISIVALGVQGSGMMEMISRSFIVFVVVVIMCAILYTIGSMVANASGKSEATHEVPQPGLQSNRTEKSAQQ